MNYRRTNYDDIRDLVFSCYFTYCKQKIRSKQRWLPPDQEHEVSFAYEQLDNAFDLPIERLMLELVVLILDAGRGSDEFILFHRGMVDSILSSSSIDELLLTLPSEEKSMFLDDLKLLQIVPA